MSKKNQMVMSVLAATLMSASAMAGAIDPQARFWADVSAKVRGCVIQPVTMVNGQKQASSLKSICQDVEVYQGGVYFRMNNALYYAYLQESAQSDGGDLYDVYVINRAGRVIAQRQNVPAFGDVLLGLAGSAQGIREQLQ
jgi:hypothetical protein